MKIALISAASAICIFGTVFDGQVIAREVTSSPIVTFHGESVIAELRAAQLDSASGVLCRTKYIPTRDDRGWYTRKSVDCEE